MPNGYPFGVSQTQTSKPANTQGGFGKLGVDLIFVLAIPWLLLQPQFPGMNFGFKDIVGSSVAALIIAALVPVTYTLVDVARTRVLNPITVLVGSGAIIGGVLAFFQVTGSLYALKDSYHSIFLVMVMGGSLLLGKPFFQVFFRSALTPHTPQHKTMLERMFAHPGVQRALNLATLVILVEAVLLGTLNFVVNQRVVVDGTFGSEVFNTQVATANAIMRVPSLVSSLLAFGLAFYIVSNGIGKAWPGVRLFEDNFFETLERAQQPAPEPHAAPEQTHEPAEARTG